MAVISGHLLAATPRFGHQRPEETPAKLRTQSPRPGERSPAGHPSRSPAPRESADIRPGAWQAPRGWSLVRRPDRERRPSHQGLGGRPLGEGKRRGPGKSGRLGGVNRDRTAPSSSPPAGISASPPPYHPPNPSLPSQAPAWLAPSRQAPCGS